MYLGILYGTFNQRIMALEFRHQYCPRERILRLFLCTYQALIETTRLAQSYRLYYVVQYDTTSLTRVAICMVWQ